MTHTPEPTKEQVEQSKTWIELAEKLGIHPRNDRLMTKVKTFVREVYPDATIVTRKWRRVDEGSFAALVAVSTSYRQVCLGLGMKPSAGAHYMVKDQVRSLALDVSHFLGQAAQRGKSFPSLRRPVHDYLVCNGPRIHGHALKLRLIKEGLKEARCEICNITEWRGHPTPIQIDHINGNRYDNRLENLRIVCPNCHAQTETYAGKKLKKPPRACVCCGEPTANRKRITCGSPTCMTFAHKAVSDRRRRAADRRTVTRACAQCGIPVVAKHKHCSIRCAGKSNRKVDWETVDLVAELKTKSKSKLARELGCSDNAINKRLRSIEAK